MQDGSSLDLSTLTSAWPIEPYSTFSNCDKLAFAKNATVTVLLGNRRPKDNEQIVSWLSNNAPDATVEFVLEPGRSARLIRKTDGLWLKNGFLIRIR